MREENVSRRTKLSLTADENDMAIPPKPDMLFYMRALHRFKGKEERGEEQLLICPAFEPQKFPLHTSRKEQSGGCVTAHQVGDGHICAQENRTGDNTAGRRRTFFHVYTSPS